MKIKCAAILFNGKIYEGENHPVIRQKMLEDGICKCPYSGGKAQGFVTECGRFVSRKEAMQIAIKAGQVDPGKTTLTCNLFSEDLKYAKPQKKEN